MKITPVALCLLVVALASPSGAQITQYINYQGRLVDGATLVNDTVSLVLRVYDSEAGGSLLCEDSNDVAVVDGLYATFIGDHITAGSLGAIAASGDAFVEVEVNGAIFTPRERIGWVAYALNADKVGGMTASAFATGAPVYVESDPVWSSASNAYLLKELSDERYVNSEGDLVTGNVDAAGGLGVRGNVIVDGSFFGLRLASQTNATTNTDASTTE